MVKLKNQKKLEINDYQLTRKQTIAIVLVLILLVIITYIAALYTRNKDEKTTSVSKIESIPAADMSSFKKTHQLIPVGEPTADYRLIYYKISPADGRLHVVVERQGTSGVSYAWRELDCSNGTQRYMGTGDNLDAAMVLRPDAQMQTPAEDSSAGRTLFFACSELLQ